MLYQIELKALRCFKFDNAINFGPESWEYFCHKHPQLERFEVSGHYFDHLLEVVKALPCLKTLKLKNVYVGEEVIMPIAENCANLEYLEIGVDTMEAENAVVILKEKLPDLRGFVKKNNYSDLPTIFMLD
jgi:hypothetical protein